MRVLGPNRYTLVADGAAPIRIPVDKGLAGAAYKTKQLINIPDAYKVRLPLPSLWRVCRA